MLVQEDLSGYWAPAYYHYDGVGTYSLMHGRFSNYYEFQTYSYDPNNSNGSPQRYPFPEGLTMLAGNMSQRIINFSDPTSTASVWQCQRSNGDSPYSHDIRDFQREGLNCDQSLRVTTRFPSCWDGLTQANSSDHTHVVYPGAGGVCPESHPKALIEMTYEWYYMVQDFPFDPTRENNWVSSFGDTSGFGHHGDFVNGWNISLMEDALANCNVDEFGIEHCPPFSAWNDTQVPPCMPSGAFPNETVGLDGQTLTSLPGCNPLWTDNSSKPTCDETPAEPVIDLHWGPDLSEWNYVSCPFAYNSQGWMLTAHAHKDWANITVDSCLAECSGYKYAMVEWATNCYCDNEIQNGCSTLSDPNYACLVRCEDTYLQFCGGFGSGQLYEAYTSDACHQNSAFPPSSPSSMSSMAASSSSTQTVQSAAAATSTDGSAAAATTNSDNGVVSSSAQGAAATVATTDMHSHRHDMHDHRHDVHSHRHSHRPRPT